MGADPGNMGGGGGGGGGGSAQQRIKKPFLLMPIAGFGGQKQSQDSYSLMFATSGGWSMQN